ncbi:signal peptidase I [Laspinema sp. D1]|uniref:Signal peptidase I n=1 Tax=Laspinema palackyanum D2a TaxID=2953684 RepID=A0ABT2MR69_9CYAN|nr:signal peptidase I [Laspinema sp. D2a]
MTLSSEGSSQLQSEKQPWIAVILSRVIPGIGQIYAGYLLRGVIIFAVWSGSAMMALLSLLQPDINVGIVGLGLLIHFALGFWNLFDAHSSARKSNSPQFETLRKSKKDPWLAVFLSLLIPGLGHFYIKKIGEGIIFFIATIVVAILAPKIFVGILQFGAAFHVYQFMNKRKDLSQEKTPLLIGLFVIASLVVSSAISSIASSALETRYIPSASMIPTLQINDRLIVDKLTYKFNLPERGDIILFSPTQFLQEQNFTDPFIFRIIGLPGETVEVINGQVKINNQPLEEPYIAEPPTYQYGPSTVPENNYFVLGDNRNNSYDSQYWGFLPKENIFGKAQTIFWPLDRRGPIQQLP